MFLKTFFLLLAFSLCSLGEHGEFERKNGFFSATDKLNVYFFQAGKHGLILKDEGSVKQPLYGSLEKALSDTSCIAGINGNFFAANEKGSPLGLSIEDGKQISPYASGSFTVSGLILDTGKGLFLMRSEQFDKKKYPEIKTALQSGPFLVEKGQALATLNNEKSTYRSFIATDGKNNWCIGVSSSLTLKELAQWLATPGTLGSFQVKTALNLDGGSSSSYWAKEKSIYFPSFKQVRNYLGVLPRGDK